jgi:hypothetical protein
MPMRKSRAGPGIFPRLGSLRLEIFIFLFFEKATAPRRNTNENGWGNLTFLPREFVMATLCTCRWAAFDGENGRELVFSGVAAKIIGEVV